MAKSKDKQKGDKARWWIRAISLVGIGVMIYLARLHFAGVGAGSVCELGKGFSCGSVNASIYSELLGIPVAFMGLGYFIVMFLLSFSQMTLGWWRFVVYGTILVLPVSFYLTGLELFVIKSICVFCEFSKLLMLAILGLAWWRLKGKKGGLSLGMAEVVLVVGIGMAVMTWFLQTRVEKDLEDLSELAACMSESGVVMYGSVFCPVCERSRRMFGDDFEKIKEIECDPRGPNPQTQLCLDKKIKKTPTWVIEREGEELDRLVGFASSEELAKFANCEDALGSELSL